ncbi:RNI-like protein [Xylaria telfairii]|nr:RNI-like protein [Xylaria telfairii]
MSSPSDYHLPLAVQMSKFYRRKIRIWIFSYLEPVDLVRASRVCRGFRNLCFDGQLWMHLDVSEICSEASADTVVKIALSAGPFIRSLRLCGCIQTEILENADGIAAACKNLLGASLQGCQNLQIPTLHSLIQTNLRLTHLNLASMTSVSNTTCQIISENCTQLESLNVSACQYMDAIGVQTVVQGCHKLKELRAGEIRGFDSLDVAKAIFQTNMLECLVLSGCDDLTDESFKTMIRGFVIPETDNLTDGTIVPSRKLRHLDVSRCKRLTTDSVKVLGRLVPTLEGLQLSGCPALTDAALQPILASTPHLTTLGLDYLSKLTNDLLSTHLAKSPCIETLQHVSISNCGNIGDDGVLPLIEKCANIKTMLMDGTKVSDLVLTKAANMVRIRAAGKSSGSSYPSIGLKLVVFDCPFVTWAGIRDVLIWNAEISRPPNDETMPPKEVIGLVGSYLWHKTVEQHTQHVLRGDFAAARKLGRKWADHMQSIEQARATGAGRHRERHVAGGSQRVQVYEEVSMTRTRLRYPMIQAVNCVIM